MDVKTLNYWGIKGPVLIKKMIKDGWAGWCLETHHAKSLVQRLTLLEKATK